MGRTSLFQFTELRVIKYFLMLVITGILTGCTGLRFDRLGYDFKFVGNLKYKNSADENENYIADGALFTVKVNALNQDGLHCLIGNVSELCQSGEIKGGNWYSFPSEVTKETVYTLPDPRVGFRMVMEVIK